ncbi:MAG: cellulase family glycosylhydrolase [Phycisphaerales bacterium]|jgi:endoglucanase|nr:cellulase family glycosylhydrolase [Phycisphaerales bacterium]
MHHRRATTLFRQEERNNTVNCPAAYIVIILAFLCAGCPSSPENDTATGDNRPPAGRNVPTQDSKLLDDLIIGFDLNEGQGAAACDVKKTGPKALLKHTVWLNDKTFGKVLDFSTATSHATLEKSVAVGKTFTIAAWMKAPPRQVDHRVIASQGKSGAEDYWDVRLDRSTGRFVFHAPGLTGNSDSGHRLDDGLWHHVMVTLAPGTMQFYVDGKLVKETQVTGEIAASAAGLTIGAAPGGRHSFDGSLARLRIFNAVKRPGDVTLIKPPGLANEPSAPRLDMKRGISIDRTQPEPRRLSTDRMITAADIKLIKAMGFDHVKVLFTPSRFMTTDGGLNKDNLWYVERVVSRVLNQGMLCVICIHPRLPFKEKYLGSLEQFGVLLRFYENFARYIARNWSADKVAFQLMTEPGRNSPELDWTYLADRMWGTVRNIMPDHTLITSGDKAGNILQLQKMSPATDPNLVYSFTTYEPYPFGFNNMMGARAGNTWWKRVGPIPYPASPSIIASQMDALLKNVPAADRKAARKAMLAYGRGDALGRYNRDWHFARARAIDRWRKKYGGTIHVQCVEFGCLDAVVARQRHGGPGVLAADRQAYIRDMRESFEAFDIAWTYWSYNETFTVLNPVNRRLLKPPDADTDGIVDADLLDALGLGCPVKPIQAQPPVHKEQGQP